MKCEMISDQNWQFILEDRLTNGESVGLLAHLETGCPDCENYLSLLDEEAELKLFAILRSFSEKPRLEQSAEPATKTREPWEWMKRGWGGRTAWATAFSLSALIVIGSIVYWSEFLNPTQIEKGIESSDGSLKLQFSIGHRNEDGEVRITRGVLGQSYVDSDQLFLRYVLEQEGYLYLLRYQGDQIELLYPGQGQTGPLAPGEYYLPHDGGEEGLALTGTEGRHVIVGIYSKTFRNLEDQLGPLVRQSVHPMTGSIDREEVLKFGQDLSMELVYFDVAQSGF